MTEQKDGDMIDGKPKNLVQYIKGLDQKSADLKEWIANDHSEGTVVRKDVRVHYSEFLKKKEPTNPDLLSDRTDRHGDKPFASFVFSAEELKDMIIKLRPMAFKADHDPLIISHRSAFEDRVRFWMKSHEQSKYVVQPIRTHVPHPVMMFAQVDLRPFFMCLWHGVSRVVFRFYPNGMATSFYTSPELLREHLVISFTIPYMEDKKE